MAEPHAETAEATAAEGELSPERVAEMIGGGEAEVVDVRTQAEHAAGHVAGARHVPLDELAGEAAATVGVERPVVFYCRVGERSAMAAEAFRASGREAYTMAGGLLAWSENGLPLEPDDGEVAHHSALPDR